jgi:hypothetical protein
MTLALLSTHQQFSWNDKWAIGNCLVDEFGLAHCDNGKIWQYWKDVTDEQASELLDLYTEKRAKLVEFHPRALPLYLEVWSPLQELDWLQDEANKANEAVAQQRQQIKLMLLYPESAKASHLAELHARCSLSVRRAKLDSPRAALLREAIAAEMQANAERNAEAVYAAEAAVADAQHALALAQSSETAVQLAFELRGELDKLAASAPTDEQITLTVRAAKPLIDPSNAFAAVTQI